MSSHTMDAVYAGYRGDEYVRLRKNWEPWYRSNVNQATAPGSPATRERVDFLESLLADAEIKNLPVVVDLGGDMGQFFPSQAATRFILDPSERPVVPGVERIGNWVELACPPSLVIIAHVLEHLNDPGATLADVHQVLDQTGFVYVEVPLDRPRLRPWHASSRYRRWLEWAFKYRLLFIFLDFWTGLFRNYSRSLPHLGVIKQSEHVNYFSEVSLRGLLDRQGFVIVGMRVDPSFRVGGLLMGRLGLLAKKAN